jgi:hypothetical protein
MPPQRSKPARTPDDLSCAIIMTDGYDIEGYSRAMRDFPVGLPTIWAHRRAGAGETRHGG